jgi:hypothetical protein
MMAIAPEKVLAEIQAFVTGVRPAEIDDRVLATVLSSTWRARRKR